MKNQLKKRHEIDKELQWRMSDVYSDETLWEEDIRKTYTMLEELKGYRGRLCSSIEHFKSGIDLMNQVQFLTEKVYFYANQKYYEDLGNTKYQKFSDRAAKLLTDVNSGSAFVTPELLEASEEVIDGYIEKDSELTQYTQYFRDLFRQKKHVLSREIEEILADTHQFSEGARDIFSVFNNVDLKFPKISDESGKEVALTHGNLILFLESSERSVREQAFRALYGSYAQYKNTLAAIYINNLKKDSFYAKTRKYASSREMYLDDSNIPGEVYDNLVDTIHKSLPLLHRYLRLRKKIMGLEELHLYDVYTPMVQSYNKEITYQKAKQMVTDGLSKMGEEYIGILKEGMENGWIDVCENEGKRSGAYSWSVYGTHPYVLLNYQPNLNNVFTIAHEMGHAIHSYYSNANQTYTNSGYKIFVAEVASTCNESLFINHLIENSSDKEEKAFMLNYFLEQFRTTVFRQTMFAEFENIVHKMADEGDALSCETLCEIYYGLNEKYFGEDVVIDKEIEMEWARIPHFYSSFYVYQYATGFSAAVALSKKIIDEGGKAVENYKKFLKAGCSDYPIEILKLAGVDMGSAEPVVMAMEMFGELLEEFETLF